MRIVTADILLQVCASIVGNALPGPEHKVTRSWIDNEIMKYIDIVGGCERIYKTAIPVAFTVCPWELASLRRRLALLLGLIMTYPSVPYAALICNGDGLVCISRRTHRDYEEGYIYDHAT